MGKLTREYVNDDKNTIKVTYNPTTKDLHFRASYIAEQWVQGEEMALRYETLVTELESQISTMMGDMGVTYNVELIMMLYLDVISNIAWGLDIRSNTPIKHLAALFVYGYEKQYKAAEKTCQEILALKNANLDKSYGYKWRDYDKYNELISQFKLPMEKITMDDFKIS